MIIVFTSNGMEAYDKALTKIAAHHRLLSYAYIGSRPDFLKTYDELGFVPVNKLNSTEGTDNEPSNDQP